MIFKYLILIFSLTCFIAIFCLTQYKLDFSIELDSRNRIDNLKIKHKIKNIVAFVFYGRERFASILFRYLNKNLKINGGILGKKSNNTLYFNPIYLKFK
jgi:hypothetical protein